MIQHLSAWSLTIAAILLGVALVAGPLIYGGVLPPARGLLVATALSALAVPVIGGRRLELRRVAVPAAVLAGVGLFGLAQSLPWPAVLAEALAPQGAQSWRTSRALLGDETEAVPLTLAPEVSREAARVWLAVAAALAAAALVGGDRRLRRGLGLALVAISVFEVLYGVRHFFAQRPEIWGRTLQAGGSRLRGTFVNPDHFAMFLLPALALSFAWGWWALRRVRRRGGLERRLFQLLVPWLVFLLLFVGLAFTGSRAGLLGALGALAVQVGLLMAYYRRWQAGLLGLLPLGVGVGGLIVFGLEQGLARWSTTSAYEITWNARHVVYRHSLELWREFPWTGTGLGTFRQAFPLVQPPDLSLSWFHAHSDILELLVTTGIVGLGLALWGLAALAVTLWRLLLTGRRSEDRAAVLAASGALVGMLCHSAVDFGLTLPANALVLAVVVGLACGVPTDDRRLAAWAKKAEP